MPATVIEDALTTNVTVAASQPGEHDRERAGEPHQRRDGAGGDRLQRARIAPAHRAIPGG
jgi:hypothetical protein